MVSFFMYALKIALPIGVFVLLYGFFLRAEKYFQVNRFFLLIGLVFGFIYPCLNNLLPGFAPQIRAAYQLMPLTIIDSATEQATRNSYSVIKILSIIYILGTTVFTVRFLFRLMQILYLTLRHRGAKIDGFIPVYVKRNQTPFTFFNLLFLPDTSEHNAPDKLILDHERVHFEQKHSIDNLVFELALIFQWFNPAVWLGKNFINSVHEFLADKNVLKKGYNKLEYQKLMVETSTGIQVAGLLSYFNATLLKKRIIMMSNYRSNKIAYLKYSFVLFVFAFAIVAMSPDGTVHAQTETNDQVFLEVEKMPEYPGGIMELRKFVARNIEYPTEAKKAGVEGSIFVKFVVDQQGNVTDVNIERSDVVNPNQIEDVVVVGYEQSGQSTDVDKAVQALENEAIRVISQLDKFTPGEQRGQKVKVQYTFPINFALN